MAKTKIKEGENLTTSNIERVIDLLEQDNPITKKSACEILNISYNTTRLNNIIQEHKDKLLYVNERKKQLRNVPVSKLEEKVIIEGYLTGESITYLTESSYRSTSTVKTVLQKYGIPLRDSMYTYKNPPLIDENFINKIYKIGDLVYAVKYGSPAYIDKVVEHDVYEHICRIRLVGENRQYAWQPYYELIDLRKVQNDLKINLPEIDDDTIKYEIAKAIINARRSKI